MRRNTSKLRFGTDVDRGGVGMLHAAAGPLRRFADVKNKKVMIERRAAHQPDFVFADLAQRVFHVALLPSVAMDHYGNEWLRIGDLKLFECAYFNGAVCEGVVVVCSNRLPRRASNIHLKYSESRRD